MAKKPAEPTSKARPKSPAKNGSAFVYVVLYLDQAESFEFAEQQIDTNIETGLRDGYPLDNLDVGIDIIATPAQVNTQAAHHTGRHLLQYIDLHYHGLRGRVVGITTDDNQRVVRDIVIRRQLPRTAIDNKTLFELE